MKRRTENLKKFGKRVLELRRQKGFDSQMAFAHRAGMDRTYIGGIERGERNPTFEVLEKLAKTLGISMEELFRF